MIRQRAIFSLLLSVSFVFVCSTGSSADMQMAFASARTGDIEVWVMNADGSGAQRITSSPGQDDNPALSPDGTKVVFFSVRDGSQDLYLQNIDGSGLIRLTGPGQGHNVHPDWSPDGTKIVFVSDRATGGDGSTQVYVMNSDGTGATRLTSMPAPTAEQYPTWSPDGQKIAFSSNLDGDHEVYVMNSDGSGATQLTNNTRVDAHPDWSPDGSKLVFWADAGGFQVFTMNSDGTGQNQITFGSGYHTDAGWSPDGQWIAYTSNEDGDEEIYIIHPDGSGMLRLTYSPGRDAFWSWSGAEQSNAPPDCSQAAASIQSAWPPNHQFVPATVDGVIDPDGDQVLITIDAVTQDEPVQGAGSGNDCPDARVMSGQLELRAERAGAGNGRVYVISYTATDEHGASCTGSVSVQVPHDQSGKQCVDDGQTFDSFGTCTLSGRVGSTEARRPKLAATVISNAVTINYELPEETDVKISIFDVTGRPVAMLKSSHEVTGAYEFSWDAHGLPCGVYLVRLQTSRADVTSKLVLVH